MHVCMSKLKVCSACVCAWRLHKSVHLRVSAEGKLSLRPSTTQCAGVCFCVCVYACVYMHLKCLCFVMVNSVGAMKKLLCFVCSVCLCPLQ